MNKFLYKIIDLSHTLSKDTPSWTGDCGFKQSNKIDYQDCDTKVKFRVQHLSLHAGIGTHIDAPAHCIRGALTAEELSLSNLIAPCVKIDISKNRHERLSLEVKDIENFESEYGRIEPGCFVLVYTGWDAFWTTPAKYHNQHIFPSVSLEACQLLLNKKIVGLGIDTLSPDRPEDGYVVHQALLSAGIYIIENVANAAALPPTGCFTMALPIKIKDSTEAPIRLIGLSYAE